MQLTFSQLRTKEVVNTQDGRKLGKVCDVVLCHPENRWVGIVAPNGKSWNPKKNGLFIDFRHVVKIGEDVILVNVGTAQTKPAKTPPADCPPPCPPPFQCTRNYDEFE
jgi:YlmC/YmxH family sporulation protein